MRRTLLASLALVTFLCAEATAQVDPGPCDTCFKNYTFDSSLVIGAHQMNSPDLTLARYPVTLHQIYSQVVKDIGDQLRDTTPISWVDDYSHPWGGYWSLLDSLDNPIANASNYGNWIEDIRSVLNGRGLRLQMENGVKVSLNPHRTNALYLSSLVQENYYTIPEGFQPFLLCDTAFGESFSTSLSSNRRASMDTLTGNFHWTKVVAAGTDTVYMGGRPDFQGSGFTDDGDNLYNDAGLPDRTKWMSLGVALRTDVDLLKGIEIDSSEAIAYIDLFIQNRLGQDTCNCWFMEPMGKIEITKEWFLERYNRTDYLGERFHKAHIDEFYDIDTLINFDTSFHGVSAFDIASITAPHLKFDTAGPPANGVSCDDWCDAELARRLAITSPSDPDYLNPGTRRSFWVDQGWFNMEVYSTGVVPLSLLRTRIAMPHYINLREGLYDSLIAEDIKDIYSDSLVEALVGQIGPGDEQKDVRLRSFGMLSAKLQYAMEQDSIGALRPKKIWSNPKKNFDEFRLYSGEFDSTVFKPIHSISR